ACGVARVAQVEGRFDALETTSGRGRRCGAGCGRLWWWGNPIGAGEGAAGAEGCFREPLAWWWVRGAAGPGREGSGQGRSWRAARWDDHHVDVGGSGDV